MGNSVGEGAHAITCHAKKVQCVVRGKVGEVEPWRRCLRMSLSQVKGCSQTVPRHVCVGRQCAVCVAKAGKTKIKQSQNQEGSKEGMEVCWVERKVK